MAKSAQKAIQAKSDVMRLASEFKKTFIRSLESREARNPLTESFNIVSGKMPRAFGVPGDAKYKRAVRKFVDDMYLPMINDADFTEAMLDASIKETFSKGQNIDITEKVAAYCALAAKAYIQGKESLGWSFVADAEYWAGIVSIAARHRDIPPGRVLAYMRHAKDQTEYANVEKYWRDNIDRKLSAQKAANKILMAEVTTFSHKKIAEIVSALRRGETFR